MAELYSFHAVVCNRAMSELLVPGMQHEMQEGREDSPFGVTNQDVMEQQQVLLLVRLDWLQPPVCLAQVGRTMKLCPQDNPMAGVRTGRDAALSSLIPCYQSRWTQVLWFWKPHKTSKFPLLNMQLSSHKKTPKCKPKHGQPRAAKAQWATGGEQGLSQRLCKVLYLPADTAKSITSGARAAMAMQTQHPSPGFPNHQSPQLNQLNTSSLAVAHLWARRFTTT